LSDLDCYDYFGSLGLFDQSASPIRLANSAPADKIHSDTAAHKMMFPAETLLISVNFQYPCYNFIESTVAYLNLPH
jgi:hypothetical protein